MGNSIVLKRRLSVALGIFLVSSGCSPKPQTGEKDNLSLNKMSETKGSAELDSHQHVEGQHGGTIVSLGADSYHAEAILETKYLTPGGKYTAEDIAANGKTIPSVKFKGIRSNHDDKPAKGDRICPISKTKANDQFLWVIDGKSYAFCCPPCIDEYVRAAKEQPDSLLAPETFIKE